SPAWAYTRRRPVGRKWPRDVVPMVTSSVPLASTGVMVMVSAPVVPPTHRSVLVGSVGSVSRAAAGVVSAWRAGGRGAPALSRAGAAGLVRGGDLHVVGAGGGVDVADGGAGRAGERLGGAVAPGDGEGEAGRLVRAGRVAGREGEVAGLAADAVGRPGDARRRG